MTLTAKATRLLPASRLPGVFLPGEDLPGERQHEVVAVVP